MTDEPVKVTEAAIPVDPIVDKPVIDSSAGRWYVVHTYSGHENKVAANLRQRIETQKLTHKIFDIVVPTRNVVKVLMERKKKSKKRFFQDTSW